MDSSLYELVMRLFHSVDYTSIAIMTALESTFLPFPSEIPMTIVGMQSAKGTMDPIVGLIVGLIGVWIGTTINYYIGYFIGDTFVEKYGKYFFIKKKDYHHAQELFEKDANFYTFFGRLLPVVRHLISIPAGMVHMPYGRFIGLSLAGSALWLAVLIALGYFIGDNAAAIKQSIGIITISCFILCIIIWIWKHWRKKSRAKSQGHGKVS